MVRWVFFVSGRQFSLFASSLICWGIVLWELIVATYFATTVGGRLRLSSGKLYTSIGVLVASDARHAYFFCSTFMRAEFCFSVLVPTILFFIYLFTLG